MAEGGSKKVRGTKPASELLLDQQLGDRAC